MTRALAASMLLLLCACAGPRVGEGAMPTASGALLLLDKSDRRLTLLQGEEPVFVVDGLAFGGPPVGHKRFEGDERTPDGWYVIDARNPASAYHLSLRVSYPNVADRAFAEGQGRDPGGDIFLHGQPNGFSGAPLAGDWTDGCIAMANADIERLYALVKDGTPILIRE